MIGLNIINYHKVNNYNINCTNKEIMITCLLQINKMIFSVCTDNSKHSLLRALYFKHIQAISIRNKNIL